MRIFQLTPTLSYGDAIGNDVLAKAKLIRDMGIVTEVFAEGIGHGVPSGSAKHLKKLPELNEDDILIYHIAVQNDTIFELLRSVSCRKAFVYHNITPPEFFLRYDPQAESRCRIGLEQTIALNRVFDRGTAVSAYNKQNLLEMGYKCPIDVVPLTINFEDYKKNPSQKILNTYSPKIAGKIPNDGEDCVNVMYCGRLAPNKKWEDIIAAFYNYQRYYNENSRLFVVGSFSAMDQYYKSLKNYVDLLGVQNVIFTGHIKFDEILAYYTCADIFLCQSEHEGFCVPLVEAMEFDVPIIAYDSTAIAETLGGSGMLLKEKDSLFTAGVIDAVVRNVELRELLVAGQRERLREFEEEKVNKQFAKWIHSFDSGGS